MAKVKNIKGTFNNNYNGLALLKYWQNSTKEKATRCYASGCKTTNSLVGVPVQKTTDDMNWYIIPLCYEHSQTEGELDIFLSTVFVLAPKNDAIEL